MPTFDEFEPPVVYDTSEEAPGELAPEQDAPETRAKRAPVEPDRVAGLDAPIIFGPSGTSSARDKLTELGLIDHVANGLWDPADPLRAEQQATAGSFPYDTNTGDADQGVDGLMSGVHWEQTALTFSFPTSAADYESNYANADALPSLLGFSTVQKNVSRDALDQYAQISGLSFTELGDDAGEQAIDADIRLAMSDDPSTAYAYYPSDNPVGGDSMFNKGSYNSPQIGNYAYHTFLHELGHALGLKHGHETSGPGAVPFEMDSMEFTVMTYRSWVGKPLDYGYANETWGFSQSLMMLDIAAIQRMYGANFNTNSGDTTYTFSTSSGEMFADGAGAGTPGGNRVFRTIWDGDGTDTYDFSNYTTDLAIDLTPGGYSDLDTGGNFQRAKLDFGYNGNPVTYARGHVFNALQSEGDTRSLIENAVGGSGNDTFIGNAADNTLTGNGGNDTFADSAGNDTYLGGAGTDQVDFSNSFASYGFTVVGTFLQVINVAIDLVEDTVEWFGFTDQTISYADIVASLGSNNAPTAFNDATTVTEDVVLTGFAPLANDSDADGDALTITQIDGTSVSAGGTVTLASGAIVTLNAGGTIDYDQNGAFDALNVGETGTEIFTYRISDGNGGADTATISFTIDGAFDNQPPNAVNDAYAVGESSTLAGNVLSDDSDPDSDPISVSAVGGSTASVGSQITLASGALLTLNSNGTFDYDPNGAFDNLDSGQTGADSFSYTISDGAGTDTATVNITINGVSPPVTETPILVDFESAPYYDPSDLVIDGLAVTSGTNLSGSQRGQTDAFGDFSITAVGADFDLNSLELRSASGRVRVEVIAFDDGVQVGSAIFNPRTNKITNASFDATFDSIDRVEFVGNGQFYVDDISMITRQEDIPGSPVAVNDTYSVDEFKAGDPLLTGNVIAGSGSGPDSDPDGDPLTLDAVNGDSTGSVTLASGAIVTFLSNGDFTYDQAGAFAALNDDETAVDTFTYEISDDNGMTGTAMVSITVNGSGTPPPQPATVVIGFEDGLIEDGFDFSHGSLTSQNPGVAAGSQAAASNGDTFIFSREDSANFDFESGVFTADNGKNVTLTVDGLDDVGAIVGSQTFRIRDNKEKTISLSDAIFDNVDTVHLTASGGVIIDELMFIV